MLSFSFPAFFCLFFLFVHCSSFKTSDLKVFEKLNQIPDSWRQNARAPSSQKIRFYFNLEQPRIAEFEDYAIRIATPGHPLYGRHLNKNEIESFFQPSPRALKAVTDWLYDAGLSTKDLVIHNSWITTHLNVSFAEHLLGTKFNSYTDNGHSIIRTQQYSIPGSLHQHVRMIHPTVHFGYPRQQHKTLLKVLEANVPSAPLDFDKKFCNATIMPACLRGQYQMGNFTINGNSHTKLGISGFLEQYARYSDLSLFKNKFTPAAVFRNYTSYAINGGLDLQNSSRDSTEANLDLQYSMAMSIGTNITYYSTAGRGPLKPDLDQPSSEENTNEPYLDQLLYLLDLPDEELPTVLSTSYGEAEQSVPPTYANVTCNLFAQLGARGVSVIFASGDTGVGSSCQTNDGRNTTRFVPTFPASCPFVTSVGGTHNINPERAATLSSGGFSDRFNRPAYQEDAVCGYLAKLGDRWQGLYNPRGRGIPDVSARSMNYYIYDHGQPLTVSGTSCATPVFAAIIANLNNLRMNAGLPSLGFLNPFLYKYGIAGFTDITEGGSRGCRGVDIYSGLPTPYIPYASWNATLGWDPVTGLGTPIFPKLVELMFKYAMPGNETF